MSHRSSFHDRNCSITIPRIERRRRSKTEVRCDIRRPGISILHQIVSQRNSSRKTFLPLMQQKQMQITRKMNEKGSKWFTSKSDDGIAPKRTISVIYRDMNKAIMSPINNIVPSFRRVTYMPLSYTKKNGNVNT